MPLELSSIKRDLQKEDEGEWIEIPEWPGTKFKVRSIECRDYQIPREMLVQRLARQLGRFPTTPELEPMLGKLVAKHLLRGWEGLAENGRDVPYSEPQAMAWLTDPTMRDLEKQVIRAAERVGERDVEFTGAAIKNSEPPSAMS